MIRWGLALVGFVYGRLWGALFGYLLGTLLEQAKRRNRGVPQQPRGDDLTAIGDLLTLAMAVARADGSVDRREVRTVRRFFEQKVGLRGPALAWLRDTLKQEVRRPADAARAAARLAQTQPPQHRRLFLALLVEIAAADGRLTPEEVQALVEVARAWGLEPVLQAWLQQNQQASPQRDRQWALNVLGLPQDADADAVRRAYRRLIREHHPDRFAHLGEAMAAQAHERFVEIQEAYRRLTQA